MDGAVRLGDVRGPEDVFWGGILSAGVSGAPTVVLCMAGLYKRFRDAGYTTPKYLLPLEGRSILAAVASELPSPRVLMIANRREEAHADAIRAAVPGAELQLVGDTSGQAETAAIGARRALELGWDGPVLFHNVDTIVAGRDLGAIGRWLREFDGYVDVFPADSPAYSYVAVEPIRMLQPDGLHEPDKSHDDPLPARITAIAEKVVISRHATTGLYGFSSPSSYLDVAARTTPAGREFYISDVYRTILEGGGTLVTDLHVRGATRVLGTPAEYEAEVARCGR